MISIITSLFRRPKLDETVAEKIQQQGYEAARDTGARNPYPRGTPAFKAYREGEHQYAAEELRVW